MKVKDTMLSRVQIGDLLLYKAKGLTNGDFLGELIAKFEGGQGRYTHAAIVRDIPDPEADVEQVAERGGVKIFKIATEVKGVVTFQVETPFENEVEQGVNITSNMGVKLEATWPRCRELSIDWENEWMEVWRVRNLTENNASDILRIQQDMVGIGPMDDTGNHCDAWGYNIAEFLTYGNLNLAAAKICSQFVAEPIYTATLLRGCKNGDYPIALTPDLRGIQDLEITPNDLALSGMAFRIVFQGLTE